MGRCVPAPPAAVAPAQAQSADLVVNHSDSPDPGPAGGVFTYTVRVDNNGPDAAIGVGLSDTLPPGSSFVGVTTTQGSCSQAAGTVSCALGDIAFLANVTVTIQVRLPTAGVWTNTATATSSTTDPNTANNLNDAENTTAQAAADMSFFSVVDAPDPVAAGQNYNYTVTARNNGPNALAAPNSHGITFTIPAGVCIRAVPTGTGLVVLARSRLSAVLGVDRVFANSGTRCRRERDSVDRTRRRQCRGIGHRGVPGIRFAPGWQRSEQHRHGHDDGDRGLIGCLDHEDAVGERRSPSAATSRTRSRRASTVASRRERSPRT